MGVYVKRELGTINIQIPLQSYNNKKLDLKNKNKRAIICLNVQLNF